MTILDTISRLSSIYIRIAPNSILYTLTKIYYPSCQQISVCYKLRVQCYSQRIYIEQSNWFIYDHFGLYFQIIFNLYSYCTKFNSIHIDYNILSILLTNFSLLYLTSAKLFTKNLYKAIKLGHFWPFWTLFPDYLQFIFILHQIQLHYTLTTIYYPSCQQISGCYNLPVQSYSQRIYIKQSNWVIFDHFGHYFQIIFNLYSYCTKFNSIHINQNIFLHFVNKFWVVITYQCKVIDKEFI